MTDSRQQKRAGWDCRRPPHEIADTIDRCAVLLTTVNTIHKLRNGVDPQPVLQQFQNTLHQAAEEVRELPAIDPSLEPGWTEVKPDPNEPLRQLEERMRAHIDQRLRNLKVVDPN